MSAADHNPQAHNSLSSSAETQNLGTQPTPQPTPPPSPQTAQSSQPTQPAPAASPAKSGPITGSIVWGALILVFCAYVASREMGGALDPITWIIVTFIGLGALLLIVGMIIVLRGSRDRR